MSPNQGSARLMRRRSSSGEGFPTNGNSQDAANRISNCRKAGLAARTSRGRSRLRESSCGGLRRGLCSVPSNWNNEAVETRKRGPFFFFFPFKTNVLEVPTTQWVTGNGLEALGRVCGAGEKPYWYDRVLAGSSLFVSGPALWEERRIGVGLASGSPLFSACPPSGSRGCRALKS